MNDEFLDYYHRELQFIREMGADFAIAYPQVAGALQIEEGRCGDPHVERLLEAFAFLTARIRKKIDDEYPEITDALLSVLYPHYQRPLPSMAIVQFTTSADPTKIAGGHVIPRGTVLKTRAVDDVNCRFRTAYSTALWPIAVEAATLIPDRVVMAGKPPEATSLLRLQLRSTAPGDWASLERFDRLGFYLDGGEPVPSKIYEFLFNCLCAVWVRGKGPAGEEKTIVLPRDSVRPVGFAPEESMVPYPARSFPGYRLLQEYLAFPAKFLFFELTNLDRIRAAGLTGAVEILFFLNQSFASELVIRPENFRLGCAPVVNLFEMVAEPNRLNHLQTEYRVVPVVNEPFGYEVFSVDRVVSSGSFLEEVVEYEQFYTLRHATRGARRGAYWFSSRKPSMRVQPDGTMDDGTEVDLAFTDPQFKPTSPPVATVTVEVTCSNRDLPKRLPFGGQSADFELESDTPGGRVRLLTRPSPSLRPPLGRSAQWYLISQLALNHLSLIENEEGPEPLRELLTLYDFGNSAVTRRMIGGIIGVASRRIAGRTGNRLGNTLSLGVEVKVNFDEEAFAGSGAFLMACVLERFLGAYVSINSFTQLVATSKQRQGIWKRWPPRCGDRTLL
jgi:type VI secretion system protein ImpG